MDRLAWCTAKSQLYLVEAAFVKDSVGRDRIRRNKDALRELRCLQEILGDLHAGEFGRAPERRRKAAEAASTYWAALCTAVSKHGGGRSSEEYCKVPPSVKRFLLALPDAAGPGGPLRAFCGSEAATSTRAPSEAAIDPDGRSTAAESHFSDALGLGESLASMALRPGGGQRLSRDQLQGLATQLREQLDQEHTSLLTSIDEVQGLMEAEVAGVELLPPLEELEAFAVAAEAALQSPELQRRKVDVKKLASANDDKLEARVAQREPCAPGVGAPCGVNSRLQEVAEALPLLFPVPLQEKQVNKSSQQEVLRVELRLDPKEPLSGGMSGNPLDSCETELDDVALADVDESGMEPMQLVGAAAPCKALSVSGSFEALAVATSSRSEEMAASCHTESRNDIARRAPARPRWADLSDDEDALLPLAPTRKPPSQRANDHGLTEAAALAGNGDQEGPAKAACGRCQELLGKDSFSRRAWRLARGLGGAGAISASERESAICRACSFSE